MTTEQVIKALECCSGIAKCIDCPYTEVDKCAMQSAKDAIALITNQMGEIRGLNSAIETLQGVAKDYEHRNENLVNENKYLRERLAEEMEHKEDMEGK